MTTQSTNTSSASDSSAEDSAKAAVPRSQQAQDLVRRNVYWALGAGLIPFPVADFLALTAVQVKMLKQLSDLYGVKFFEDKAKTIVGALITGTGSMALAGMAARSVVKLLPGVGQLIGFVGVPVLAGALTLAIGNLFVMHYESGGTLLDFDAQKMRAHFQKELANAKESVKQMQPEKKSTKNAP